MQILRFMGTVSEGAPAERLRSEPAWKDCLKSLGIIQGRVLKIWPIYAKISRRAGCLEDSSV
jgi:hypothetical protein